MLHPFVNGGLTHTDDALAGFLLAGLVGAYLSVFVGIGAGLAGAALGAAQVTDSDKADFGKVWGGGHGHVL